MKRLGRRQQPFAKMLLYQSAPFPMWLFSALYEDLVARAKRPLEVCRCSALPCPAYAGGADQRLSSTTP